MHFAVYVILKDTKLEDFDYNKFEEDFSKKFCDGCGEQEPEIDDVCDWFELGGRWIDELKATKGIHGNPAWMMDDFEEKDGEFSVCEIKDLLDTGEEFEPYAFVMDDDYTEEGQRKYKKILNEIRNKTLNGVLVLLDCHM